MNSDLRALIRLEESDIPNVPPVRAARVQIYGYVDSGNGTHFVQVSVNF